MFGAADIDRLAGDFLNLGFDPRRGLGKVARQPRQHLTVDRDAAPFHPRQHRDQRPLQRLVDRGHPFRDEPRLQHSPQPQDRIGALGRIFGGLVDRDLIERKLVLATAGEAAVVDHGVAEPAFREPFDPVSVAAGVERVRHQLSIVVIAQGDAVLRQHHRVELDVEADLQNAGGFQQRFQRRKRIAGLDLVRCEAGVEQAGAAAGLLVAERDIAGIVRRQRQRDTGHFGLHRIDRIGHRLDREMPDIMRPGEPRLKLIEAADGFVLLAIERNFADRFLAGGGKRDRRALEARRLARLICRSSGNRFLARQARLWAALLRDGPVERINLLRQRQSSKNAGAAFVTRICLDIGGIDLRIFGDAASEGGKLHRLQERDQFSCVGLVHRKLVERHFELDLVVEQHELPRDSRLFGIFDQRLTSLRLLDLAGAQQQRLQVAVFDDQLRRGLDADAGHARHIVGGIAGQRLHLDHLCRRYAELFDHLGNADAAVLHGVVHGDAVGDELHQVLVRRHDGRRCAALAGNPRIGRDQVVGLKTALLQAGQVERANGLADQRELRDQIVRRRRPVRLVIGIELVAEGDLGFVEYDRQMRRPVVGRHVAQQLPQHVAEAQHGIDLQTVGFAAQRRQRVIGAKNVGGTIDQEDMVALGELLGGDGFCGGGGFGGCFRHGRNLGIFARIDSLAERESGPPPRLFPPAVISRQRAGTAPLLRRL